MTAPGSASLPRYVTDAHGDRRVVYRLPRVSPFPHLNCPDGHPIRRTSFSLEEDTFRCETKLAGGATCGLYLYVLAEFHAQRGERLLLSVEVTSDEIKRFRRWPLLDKLRYLQMIKETDGRS